MYYSDHFAMLGRYQAPSFNQNPEDTKWMFTSGYAYGLGRCNEIWLKGAGTEGCWRNSFQKEYN